MRIEDITEDTTLEDAWLTIIEDLAATYGAAEPTVVAHDVWPLFESLPINSQTLARLILVTRSHAHGEDDWSRWAAQ